MIRYHATPAGSAPKLTLLAKARLSRLAYQRYGSGGGYSNVGNGTSRKPLGPTSKHKMLDCKVIFLDGEDETFPITVSSHDFYPQFLCQNKILTKKFNKLDTTIIEWLRINTCDFTLNDLFLTKLNCKAVFDLNCNNAPHK